MMSSEEQPQITFNRHLEHTKTALSSSKVDANHVDDHQSTDEDVDQHFLHQ